MKPLEIFDFGALLRRLRAERDISQTALARQLSVSQDTVSLWECGKSYPDFHALKRLAALFDVSADYLVGLTEY